MNDDEFGVNQPIPLLPSDFERGPLTEHEFIALWLARGGCPFHLRAMLDRMHASGEESPALPPGRTLH